MHPLSTLYDQPLAVAESYLQTIGAMKAQLTWTPLAVKKQDEPMQEDYVPVIEVAGLLLASGEYWYEGITTYQSIKAQTKMLVAEGYKEIFFKFASGGGTTEAMLSTAEFLASVRDSGVTLTGIVDGQMCSACYILGTAMSTIAATKSSEIGSIGVMGALGSYARNQKDNGIDMVIVRSRSGKAIANPNEEISEEAISELKAQVTALDTLMVETATSNRPSVTLAVIDTLNGKTVLAAEALELGLVDSIVASIDEVINRGVTASSTTIGKTTMNLEEALQANAELTQANTTLKAEAGVAATLAVTEERARVSGIMTAGATLGVPQANIQKRIQRGSTVADATDMFEELAEMQDSKTAIATAGEQVTLTQETLPTAPETGLLAGLANALDNQSQETELFKGVI